MCHSQGSPTSQVDCTPCDAPLQRAIEEAPSDVATAIAAATRTICMRSQRGFGTRQLRSGWALLCPVHQQAARLGNAAITIVDGVPRRSQ